MLELLKFIDFLLNVYIFVLFAAAVLSWLIVFNEPVLRPIRERLPNFGGIDISFIVVILIIYFIQWVIIPNLARAFI